MTDIVPAPDVALSSQFPTNADRVAGVFNAKAAAWADSSRTMAADMDAAAKSAETNALAAKEQALAAQGAATTATEQADAAMDFRNEAVNAKNLAVPAAAAAAESEDFVRRMNLGPHATFPTLDNQGRELLEGAEFLYTGVTPAKRYSWDGTQWLVGTNVTAGVSQVDGKTGALSLADTSYPLATQVAMEAGESTAPVSVTPALVRAAVMGSVDELASALPAQVPGGLVSVGIDLQVPEWLKISTAYLRSAYPLTAAKVAYQAYTSGAFTSENSADFVFASISRANAAEFFVIADASANLHTFSYADGALTPMGAIALASIDPPAPGASSYSISKCSLSADGEVLIVSYLYQISSTYYYATRVLKRSSGSWTHLAWIAEQSTSASAALMRTGAFVDGTGYRFAISFGASLQFADINASTGEVVTTAAAPPYVPTSANEISYLHFAEGRLLVIWNTSHAGAQGDAAIFDLDADDLAVASRHRISNTYASNFVLLSVSCDGRRIVGYRPNSTGSVIAYCIDMSALTATSIATAGAGATVYGCAISGEEIVVRIGEAQTSIHPSLGTATGRGFYPSSAYPIVSLATNVGDFILDIGAPSSGAGPLRKLRLSTKSPTFSIEQSHIITGSSVPPFSWYIKSYD